MTHNTVDKGSIGRIVTVSCTGFAAPGIDALLIRELDLPRTVRRTHIGFMGCAASLIGLSNIFSTQGGPPGTLLVSVELCSLHLHFEATKDNILANTIFGDGAAAALFSPDTAGGVLPRFACVRSASVLFDDSSALMGWKIGDNGFEMLLSQDLPRAIRERAVPALLTMLEDAGLQVGDIAHWALHPGGRAILDALQDGLGLDEEAMLPSRMVLRDFGNMSSATILFVLKEVLHSGLLHKGELCCAVGFGPGLTMEVVLLRVE
jgi:alkylresorcinol/alkylpyrone synthase